MHQQLFNNVKERLFTMKWIIIGLSLINILLAQTPEWVYQYVNQQSSVMLHK